MASGNEVVHRIRSAPALRDNVIGRCCPASAVATDVVVTAQYESRESLPRTAVASGSGRAALPIVGAQAEGTPTALQLLGLEVSHGTRCRV